MNLKLMAAAATKAATGLGIGALIASLFASNLSFAADIKVLDTNLKGGVASPNAAVNSPDNILPKAFTLDLIAAGIDPLENPSGVITKFGFLSTGTRTEPDENTYLILDHNPGGPTAGYDYGRHFLFQGHENSSELAYITRINLDVSNPDHRITLLTPVGQDGLTHFNSIDGSTWNPFTKTLLFTQEVNLIANVPRGGIIEVPVDWPSTPRTLYGIIGHGSYEGIHPDSDGNLYLAEDSGGTFVNVDPNDSTSPQKARNPNSFIYRFLPDDRTDLSNGGKLQALQVWIDGQPVMFVPVDANHPFGDVFSTNQLKLHTLGTSWPARWVTVHDTDVDGKTEFDANALAKAAGATPFKRPENLQFLPGSDFKTFFFDATGDTDKAAGDVPDLAARGSWGSIFRVDFGDDHHFNSEFDADFRFLFGREADTARISIVVLGDQNHASFDNLTFADENVLLAAEDRGDDLHDQLKILDSVWAYDVTKKNIPTARLIALGRDLDSSPSGAEDNEPTGLHFSEGKASIKGLIGTKTLNPNQSRLFFTQQHGENVVWEVLGKHGPQLVFELGK
jgi:Bacterial protein of unknown function (DUF839)